MSRAPLIHAEPVLLPESNWKSIPLASLLETVLNEIQGVLSHADEAGSQRLVEAIFAARQIVVHASGRMGIMSSAFAMRLAQLGFRSHVLGAPTTPGVGKEDLLILSSASGETQTVYEVAVLAKEHNVRIALITSQPDSRTGRLADIVVKIPMFNKLAPSDSPVSIQPMTTLSEQSLLIYFDLLVLWIMQASGQTGDDLWQRHFNLE
jgi:6-phospho-3-hexuloisomerase